MQLLLVIVIITKKKILVNSDEYYKFFKSVYTLKDNNLQIRIAPYCIPKEKFNEFTSINNFEKRCLIYDKEIIHIDPRGNIYPCVLFL